MMEVQTLFQKLESLLKKYAPFKKYENELNILKRYNEPPHILFMGEFSVGKSSVINALLQRDILPSSATPTTAFVTFLRYGDEGVEVVYTNGEKEYVALDKLSTVSSEIELDEQLRTKEIERVNVTLPHPLLKKVTIVDSPGLNSLHESHTQQTYQIIQQVDFCFWVFAYGKVGTKSESESLKMLKAAGLRPVALINKIDQADEDDLEEYYAYEAKKMFSYTYGVIGVSAYEAIEGRKDPELYTLSNYSELHERIDKMVSSVPKNRHDLRDEMSQLLHRILEDLERMKDESAYADEVILFKKETSSLLREYFEIDELRYAYSQNHIPLYPHIQQLIDLMTKVKHFDEWLESDYIDLLQGYAPIEYWKKTYDFYVETHARLVAAKQRPLSSSEYEQLVADVHQVNDQWGKLEGQVQQYAETIEAIYQKEYVQQLKETPMGDPEWIERQRASIINCIHELDAWSFLPEIQDTIIEIGEELKISLPLSRNFSCASLKKETFDLMEQREALLLSKNYSFQPNELHWNRLVLFPELLPEPPLPSSKPIATPKTKEDDEEEISEFAHGCMKGCLNGCITLIVIVIGLFIAFLM